MERKELENKLNEALLIDELLDIADTHAKDMAVRFMVYERGCSIEYAEKQYTLYLEHLATKNKSNESD